MPLKRSGIRVAAWAAVASSGLKPPNCFQFPAAGYCRARNQVTRWYNEHLARLCAKGGIPHVGIFPHLVDARGLTRMALYQDPIHLGQNALPLALNAMRRAGLLSVRQGGRIGQRKRNSDAPMARPIIHKRAA